MPEAWKARLSCRAGIARAGASRAGYFTGSVALDRLPSDRTFGGDVERESTWTRQNTPTTTWTEV